MRHHRSAQMAPRHPAASRPVYQASGSSILICPDFSTTLCTEFGSFCPDKITHWPSRPTDFVRIVYQALRRYCRGSSSSPLFDSGSSHFSSDTLRLTIEHWHVRARRPRTRPARPTVDGRRPTDPYPNASPSPSPSPSGSASPTARTSTSVSPLQASVLSTP